MRIFALQVTTHDSVHVSEEPVLVVVVVVVGRVHQVDDHLRVTKYVGRTDDETKKNRDIFHLNEVSIAVILCSSEVTVLGSMKLSVRGWFG